MPSIKPPAVAGQFYEADAHALRDEIRGYLDAAEVSPTNRKLAALIVPHAGYFYSGAAAACGYRLAEGQDFDTVVIFGLSHRVPCHISILDADGYQTPLGVAEIDTELVRSIRERMPGLEYQVSAHRMEHSVEVQIPFIQVALPGAKIVEILLQADDPQTCSALGQAVAGAIRAHPEKKVLIVGSTDMTHYQSYTKANEIDRATLEVLKSLEMDTIRETIENTEMIFGGRDCALCSKGAVYAVLETTLILGGNRAEIVTYRNSGDAVSMEQTGGRVVGYGVIAVYEE